MTAFRPVSADLKDAVFHFYRLLDKRDAPNTIKAKIQYGLIAGLTQFGYAFLLSLIISLVFTLLPFEPKNWVAEEANNNPSIGLFLIIALIGPIVEEGVFRPWLGRISYWVPLIFSSIFLAMGSGLEIPTMDELLSPTYLSFMVITVIPILYCVVQLLRGERYFNPPHQTLRLLFWLSVFIFGIYHAENYVNDQFPLWYVIVLSPLLLSPQIVGGYILGVCRIRAGLMSAMLAHCVNNSISSVGIYFGSMLETPQSLTYAFSLLSW